MNDPKTNSWRGQARPPAWLAVEPGQAQSPPERLAKSGRRARGPFSSGRGAGPRRLRNRLTLWSTVTIWVLAWWKRGSPARTGSHQNAPQKVEGYQMRLILDVGYPRTKRSRGLRCSVRPQGVAARSSCNAGYTDAARG